MVDNENTMPQTRELGLVGLNVLLLQLLHVVSNVLAEDVLAVNTSIKLLAVVSVAGEAAVAVRTSDLQEDGQRSQRACGGCRGRRQRHP